MALRNSKLLICLLILSKSTLAQAKCLRTVSELKAHNVKARWQETTANDGKPLSISITDGANGLVYSAKKAGVLWLTGHVSVCPSGGATEITLKNTRATGRMSRCLQEWGCLPRSRPKLLMTGSNWEVEDGAEPSLVNNSSSAFLFWTIEHRVGRPADGPVRLGLAQVIPPPRKKPWSWSCPSRRSAYLRARMTLDEARLCTGPHRRHYQPRRRPAA